MFSGSGLPAEASCPHGGYDPHPDPRTVGETLRAYRRALGLKQRELAEQLGAYRSTLGKVETGRERPSEAMLGRMKSLLGALLDG